MLVQGGAMPLEAHSGARIRDEEREVGEHYTRRTTGDRSSLSEYELTSSESWVVDEVSRY